MFIDFASDCLISRTVTDDKDKEVKMGKFIKLIPHPLITPHVV